MIIKISSYAQCFLLASWFEEPLINLKDNSNHPDVMNAIGQNNHYY
jgi:hypothetical protein